MGILDKLFGRDNGERKEENPGEGRRPEFFGSGMPVSPGGADRKHAGKQAVGTGDIPGDIGKAGHWREMAESRVDL